MQNGGWEMSVWNLSSLDFISFFCHEFPICWKISITIIPILLLNSSKVFKFQKAKIIKWQLAKISLPLLKKWWTYRLKHVFKRRILLKYMFWLFISSQLTFGSNVTMEIFNFLYIRIFHVKKHCSFFTVTPPEMTIKTER